MLADQLSLLGDAPSSAPAPRRHRCPTCHAGFAPVGVSARIAAQRAKARDYAAEWAAFVVAEPARVEAIVAAARCVARTRRPSIAAVWLEVLTATGVALDHNHRAPAARWLMATVPELRGVFVTRERSGQVPERGR